MARCCHLFSEVIFMTDKQLIQHPLSKTPILGYRLEPGDTIRIGDIYDSSSGKWSSAPEAMVGLTL